MKGVGLRLSYSCVLHKCVFLPPANEFCEGYVFTPVCQSFCLQGEYLGRYTPQGRYTPWAGNPQWADTPPRAGTPPGQVHAGRYTPRQVHPSGQVHPPQRSLQRTVRILLECFLVCRFNSSFQRQTTVIVHTILKNLRIKIVPLGQAT